MIKLILALILCMVSTFAPNGNAADVEETYIMDGSYCSQTIIETTDGNLWKVGGTSEQTQGCAVRVVLDSKGTIDMRDDEILEVIAI